MVGVDVRGDGGHPAPLEPADHRLAASEAMPCPCQGTPTAQATSAARPRSEKAACSMPTARPSPVGAAG
jgi:hypothetical protein